MPDDIQQQSNVNVVSPEGDLESVAPQDVQSAVDNEGYKVAGPTDVAHYKIKEKYGKSLLDPLKASMLGAARGASFGLSDQMLVHSGLANPRDVSGYQEANPVASTVGEVAGVVAPALMGEEAGLTNLPGMVSKTGSGVERAAADALGTVGSKALGSAVEGAAYGLGNVVSEEALGDPDLTAQSALAQVGLSSLGMGVIGGTLGLGAKMLPEALLGAKKGILEAEEVALGKQFEPNAMEKAYAKASSAVSGKSEEDILKALQYRHISMPSQAEKMELSKDFATALQDQYSNVDKELRGSFNKAREAESKSLLASVDPELIGKELESVKNRLDQAIIGMEQEPELFPARFSRKLELLREGLERDTQDASSHDMFKAIDDLKGKIDKEIPYGRDIQPQDKDAIASLDSLRSDLKTTLEKEDIFGEAAKRQKTFNEATNDYLTSVKEFKKNFLTKTGTRNGKVAYKVDPIKVNTFLNQINDARGAAKGETLTDFQRATRKIVEQMETTHNAVADKGFDRGAIEALIKKVEEAHGNAESQARMTNTLKSINSMGGAMGESLGVGGALAAGHPILAAAVEGYHMLRNPSLAIQRLAALEKLVQRTTSTIEKGAKAILRPNELDIVTKSKTPYKESVEDLTKKFDKRADNIRKLNSNPQGFVDQTTEALSGVNQHAPKVAAGMSQSAAAGIAFLASKLPNKDNDDPFAPKQVTSPTEIAKFNQYYDIVKKPLSILDKAKDGTLTTDHLLAIKQVYPVLYQHIQTTLMSEMANKRNKSLPYRSKLMVSMLLGKNVGTTSLSPLSIIANQMILHPPGQAMIPSMPKATPASANKLTMSNRFQTPLQSTIARTK